MTSAGLADYLTERMRSNSADLAAYLPVDARARFIRTARAATRNDSGE
jgi:hypothetical protein